MSAVVTAVARVQSVSASPVSPASVRRQGQLGTTRHTPAQLDSSIPGSNAASLHPGYLGQQVARCGAARSRWPWQSLRRCIWLGRRARGSPCWVSVACPPGRCDGHSGPCTQPPAPESKAASAERPGVLCTLGAQHPGLPRRESCSEPRKLLGTSHMSQCRGRAGPRVASQHGVFCPSRW